MVMVLRLLFTDWLAMYPHCCHVFRSQDFGAPDACINCGKVDL